MFSEASTVSRRCSEFCSRCGLRPHQRSRNPSRAGSASSTFFPCVSYSARALRMASPSPPATPKGWSYRVTLPATPARRLCTSCSPRVRPWNEGRRRVPPFGHPPRPRPWFVGFSSQDGVGVRIEPRLRADTWEVWCVVQWRAVLSHRTEGRDAAEELQALIRFDESTCLFLTTSLFNSTRARPPATFGDLRVLGIGGEAAILRPCRRVLASESPPARCSMRTTNRVDELLQVGHESRGCRRARSAADRAPHLQHDAACAGSSRTPGAARSARGALHRWGRFGAGLLE